MSNDILAAIIGGDHDDSLDAIDDAVATRRKSIALALNIGQRVRLTDRVKPKYLQGVTGTLVKREAKRGGNVSFRMEVDEDQRDGLDRFLSPIDHTIGGPASLFEAIDTEAA